MWVGVVGDQVQNFNEVNQLELLQQELISDLAVLFSNRTKWFHQDSASPHVARPVWEFVDAVFPVR